MPQRADKIAIHPGHRILFSHSIELCFKQGLLQNRIVQFGLSIGKFHSMNE